MRRCDWPCIPDRAPRSRDAVAVGELLRWTSLKKHGVPSEALSGKTPSGSRRLDRHQHAHYLSLARDSKTGVSRTDRFPRRVGSRPAER